MLYWRLWIAHAVSASGIYRTSDGGQTWTLVLGGAVGTDAVFNPPIRPSLMSRSVRRVAAL